MRFINANDPTWTGFVNKVIDKTTKSGTIIKTYLIGTSERDNRVDPPVNIYSSWFCTLGSAARELDAAIPLKEGDRIKVTARKDTNVSYKKDDGTYTPAYLATTIFDYEVMGSSDNSGNYSTSGKRNTAKISHLIDEDDSEENPFGDMFA